MQHACVQKKSQFASKSMTLRTNYRVKPELQRWNKNKLTACIAVKLLFALDCIFLFAFFPQKIKSNELSEESINKNAFEHIHHAAV